MLISMVQFFDPEFFVNPRFKVDVLEGNHRVSSIFTWEGDEKGALFTVPILLAILITFKNRKLNWKDFFLLVFPVFIIVFLTGSRAAILNFSIVLFWYFRRNFSFTLIANIILSVILLFIALLALNFDFEFFINNRLQADTDSRLVIFEYVGIKIAESPLIGDGLGGVKGIDNSLGLTFGNRVHNGFLAVLLNYGFIGLFLFTGFIISWFFEMRRSARQTGFYGGLLTFYIFFVTNISVDITHFLWPGLTLAIVYKKYQDDHKKSFYENTIHLNR
jgi:O-antigen ligase